MLITIDGPAGSGKSSLARALAQKLDFCLMQTGLLYRGLALLIVDDLDLDLNDDASLEKLSAFVAGLTSLQARDLCDRIEFSYRVYPTRIEILLDEAPVELEDLADARLSLAASVVSPHPDIRKALMDLQRAAAKDQDVVVEGRDSGSVVFRHADLKLFLTANPEVRAARVASDTTRTNGDESIAVDQALADIKKRDNRDISRKHSPLTIPEGAVVIDNSELSIEESLDKVLELVQEALAAE